MGKVILFNAASVSDLLTQSVTFWSAGKREPYSLKEIPLLCVVVFTSRIVLLLPHSVRQLTSEALGFCDPGLIWDFQSGPAPAVLEAGFQAMWLHSVRCSLGPHTAKGKQPKKQENSAIIKIIQILIKWGNACFMNNKGCNQDLRPLI